MQAPNAASLLYTDEYEQWEQSFNLKVFTGTRDTFMDLFDDDETLTYEPETTAAIVLTDGDEEAEKAALEVPLLLCLIQQFYLPGLLKGELSIFMS